jgi:hypothetical protein
MTRLNDTQLELIKKGVVDLEEAYSKAVSRQEFADLLQHNGPQGTRAQAARAEARRGRRAQGVMRIALFSVGKPIATRVGRRQR